MNGKIAAYQIYALKSDSTDDVTAEVPAPLLRWWDAYPPPKAVAELMTSDELMSLIRNAVTGETNFAVIDVRRNDHAVSVYLIPNVFLFSTKHSVGRPRSWQLPVGCSDIL